MPDLPALTELVVGELHLERLDHPSGEVLPDEREHRLERILRRQPATSHGVDMSPVDYGSDEGELGGELGDIPETAEGPGVAGRFQTHAHSK